jgi:hypothetical protein
MLVHFTIDSGTVPITEQAREAAFAQYLRMLREYDANAEGQARQVIQQHLTTHTEFTAKHIACTGQGDAWHPEFESLYNAMRHQHMSPDDAYDEARKFLGLLVWNEALQSTKNWHFTKYPKADPEYMVTHYFAVDGHIRANAKRSQASTARDHGDEQRAADLENAAGRLEERWGQRRR